MTRIRLDGDRATSRALLAAGTALGLACLIGGCGNSEPKVTMEFPASSQAAPKFDPKAPRPKGMPKNTTADLKIDPQTGRPVSR